MNTHELNKRQWTWESIHFIESPSEGQIYVYPDGILSLSETLRSYNEEDVPVGFDNIVRFIRCREGRILSMFTLSEAKRILKISQL